MIDPVERPKFDKKLKDYRSLFPSGFYYDKKLCFWLNLPDLNLGFCKIHTFNRNTGVEGNDFDLKKAACTRTASKGQVISKETFFLLFYINSAKRGDPGPPGPPGPPGGLFLQGKKANFATKCVKPWKFWKKLAILWKSFEKLAKKGQILKTFHDYYLIRKLLKFMQQKKFFWNF